MGGVFFFFFFRFHLSAPWGTSPYVVLSLFYSTSTLLRYPHLLPLTNIPLWEGSLASIQCCRSPTGFLPTSRKHRYDQQPVGSFTPAPLKRPSNRRAASRNPSQKKAPVQSIVNVFCGQAHQPSEGDIPHDMSFISILIT